ncbi:hypothetical protein BDF20DRAFT_904540 [Mycotypha africana]|uniref:uncharacterized protein n=1 Tax=Mycotypha africana TaxID=64632 RepID=UPI00230149C3|nr:uncharacterized protein BDF20DRAFT_904540 [Mycotypha africana]KAI8987415.1 hypothetical protein BDF20DRAFT_904540 [Mycotypha africana]
MSLLENAYGTGKKPPFALLLALINFILKPKHSFKKKQTLKEHWLHCKRAHAILLDILSVFGPKIFNPMWNQFRYFELISTEEAKAAQDDDYDDLDTEELANYSDFWNFTDRTLNCEAQNLEAKCRILMLDFFVNVLQVDLKYRVDSEASMQDAIFVRTLKKDALSRISKFDNYIKILLRTFPQKDENLLHLTGDILNMLITISCFARIAKMDDLVTQLYIPFQEMSTDICQQLMQSIKYPSFLIALCDKAVSDTDISKVEEQHKHYRHTQHVPLHLEKLFFYVLKTLPHDKKNLDSIYRHVAIVSKYCMAVFATATVRHKRENSGTNSALPESQLELLIMHQHEAVEKWETMIENLIDDARFRKDLDTIEQIRWAIKLTRLTMTEYF